MSDATADLKSFFAPRSIALVGATEDLTKFGGRCFKQMIDFGFPGPIYPINTRADTVRGVKSYKSLRDLPETPDHVGIVVPAPFVADVIQDCAAKGVKNATVFTSGFGEMGTDDGRALQKHMVDLARKAGIRLMGPNCNGWINYVDAVAMTSTVVITGPRKPAGNIGIVAHSGGVGQVNAMWRSQQEGLNVSYQMSCGNDADLDALDYARFLIEDPSTKVVMMVLERISSGPKLAKLAADAADAKKPIVIVKIGRSEVGARAAASHTGAVTGSDLVHDVAFRQLGIIRVDDCNELYETAMLLRTGRLPRGPRLASLSISGGSVVLLSDLAANIGLEWPEYSEETQAVLASVMPSFGHAVNPTDLTGGAIGSPDRYRKVLNAVAADDVVDTLIPIITFAPKHEFDAVSEVAKSAEKPVAVLWTGGCNDVPDLTKRFFTDADVPVYRDPLPCVRAIRRATDYSAFLKRRAARGAPQRPSLGAIDRKKIRDLLDVGGALTERSSKEILAQYRFPLLREELAANAEQAAEIASRFGGDVALKIESPDIPHKTEAGGVRLALRGSDAVVGAYREIMSSAKSYAPKARLTGVLVQEMAPKGQEIILGQLRDPVFGPVIAVGLGGVSVELLGDLSHRIAPIGYDDARDMLSELKVAPLFRGFRGRPPLDVEAMCDLIVRLSALATDFENEIEEIDLNPIVLLEEGKGARAVDALVVAGARP